VEPSSADHNPAGTRWVSTGVIGGLCVVVSIVGVILLYTLWAFWPDTGVAGKAVSVSHVTWFGRHMSLRREADFFLVVGLAGTLGGLIHTIRSLSWYVGNRRLRWSWVPWLLMLPVTGALGGTVFYLVLRAGLFSPSTSVDTASPFGFAAVAVLVGLFSEQALEKLRDVAGNIFAASPVGTDHVGDQAAQDGTEEAPAASPVVN
jgi:hypothetical protein